jgi:hypothetical protein
VKAEGRKMKHIGWYIYTRRIVKLLRRVREEQKKDIYGHNKYRKYTV